MKKTIYGLIILGALACSEAPVVVDGAVQSNDNTATIAVADAGEVKTSLEENVETVEQVMNDVVVDTDVDPAMSQSKLSDVVVAETVRTEVAKVVEEVNMQDDELAMVKESKGAAAPATTPQAGANFDHSAFNTLLQRHVTKSGAVNYGSFKGNAAFEGYLKKLSANPPRDSWPKGERMAYWINAYNAFTIKLIVDNMPLKSIKDISSPWKKKFFQIDGKDYDLNTIEHEILRKQFDDPRIHFAINCASASCPKLLNMTFEARKLESQLEQAAKEFVNDPFRNNIEANAVQISKIFDWFKGDFTNKNRTIIQYLNKYSNTVISESTKVKYKDYSWELNNK